MLVLRQQRSLAIAVAAEQRSRAAPIKGALAPSRMSPPSRFSTLGTTEATGNQPVAFCLGSVLLPGRDVARYVSGPFEATALPDNSGHLFKYWSTQPFTVWYHRRLFWGLSTQWPSSGKYSILEGTFRRCRVVKS